MRSQANQLFLIVFILVMNIDVMAQGNKPANIIVEQEVLINGNKNTITIHVYDSIVSTISKQFGVTAISSYSNPTKEFRLISDIAGRKQEQVFRNYIDSINREFQTITLDYFDQVKEIAGISCKMATLTLQKDGKVSKRSIWYAPNLLMPFAFNFGVPGLELIKGLPMEYEHEYFGFKFLHQVSKIKTN